MEGKERKMKLKEINKKHSVMYIDNLEEKKNKIEQEIKKEKSYIKENEKRYNNIIESSSKSEIQSPTKKWRKYYCPRCNRKLVTEIWVSENSIHYYRITKIIFICCCCEYRSAVKIIREGEYHHGGYPLSGDPGRWVRKYTKFLNDKHINNKFFKIFE